MTEQDGHFLVGKYYQENRQQILVEDDKSQSVERSSVFYKFISSKEFDPDKYSVVTSLLTERTLD